MKPPAEKPKAPIREASIFAGPDQSLEHPLGIGFDPVKLNVGVTPHVLANGRAHIAGHQGRTKADRNPALLTIADGTGSRLKIVDIGKDAPGNTQERLALFGRYRAARAACR